MIKRFYLLTVCSVVIALSANAQFTALNGPPGGSMNDLEVDPNNSVNHIVYTVSNNSLYVSSTDGTTWTKVVPTTPSNLYIADLMIDGSTLFALYYYQLYSSTDGGANWTLVNNNGAFNGAYKMIKLATGVYAVYGYNGVYVSKDAGVTWTQITTVYAYSAVANSTGDLYISDSDGIKKHVNPGTNPWASGSVTTILADPNDGASLGALGTSIFAAVYSSNPVTNANDILKYKFLTGTITATTGSKNVTGTATLFTTELAVGSQLSDNAGNPIGKVASITNNTNLVLVANAQTAVAGGAYATWVSAKTGIAETYFSQGTWSVSPAGLYFVNNYYSKIYFTTTASAGASWSTASVWPSANYGNSTVNDLRFGSGTKAFAGTNGDGVFLGTYTTSTSNSATWTLATGGIYLSTGQDIVVGTGSPARVIVRTGYASKGFWYSDDKGVTWNFLNSPLNQIYKLTKMSNGTLIGLGYNAVQYSTNNGVGWTNSGTGGDFFRYLAYNVNFSSGTYNYGITDNRLASTTTAATWTTITVTGLPTNYSAYGLAQDNGGNLFALVYNNVSTAANKYEVYKIVLTGGVATATTATATLLAVPFIPADLPPNYFNPTGTFVNNNKLYISSSNTIYYTADQGATWSSSVFSNNGLFALPNGGNGICASTYGALYVSSDDGKSWSDNAMPNSDGYIQAIAYDVATTTYYASGYNTPALKNVTTSLLPASPPAYINFNWAATNGPWGGNINKVLVDNASNSFAATQGSLFKTTTFSSWTDVSQGNYFYDVDIDKPNNKIYGMGYNQIFTSISGGAWTLLNGNESFGGSYYFRHCSNGDLVMGTFDSKVYVSTNGGTSFGAAKYTIADGYVYDVQVTSTATPGMFLYYYDNPSSTAKLVRSIDRGVTWTAVTTPGTYLNNISGRGSNVYISTYDNTSGNDVSKSADNGTTWTSIKGDLPPGDYRHLFVSPTSDLYLAAYDYNTGKVGLYKSTNAGVNWTFLPTTFTTNVPNDVNWVGTRMVVSSDQGIFTSDDGGVTYTERNTGIPQSNLNDVELASQGKLLASNGNKDFYSTDFQNWSTLSNYSFRGFARKPDGTLLAFDNGKIYQTPDGGNSWNVISSTLPGGLNTIATADGSTFYGSSYSTTYYSNNLSTWTQLSPTGLPSSFSIQDIAVDQNGISYLVLYNYTTSLNEAYEILFGAAVKINQVKNPTSVEFSQNKIFLYDGNGALLTTPDGTTWTKNAAPGGNKLIIASQNYYFIPSYGGNLWLSRDQGQTWQNVGLGASTGNNDFNDVVINEYNGYAYGAISNSPVRKSGNIVIPADVVAPVVTSVSPANNATGISLKPTLSITFDQAAVPVAGKFLRILDVANPVTPVEVIDVSLSVQNGKTFSFTPVNFLTFNKNYFIIVDNGAFTDIFANAWSGITSNSTWKFTTKLTPTLNSLSPATNATGVATLPTLTMTFSEAMSPVNGKNFYIYDAVQTSTPVVTITTNIPTNDFATISPAAASPEQSVTVIFDANKGGGELGGASKVYLHAGVITDSPTGTAWQNTVGHWGLDDGVGQMTAVVGRPNVWQITLSPTLRQYFSVANGTTIYRLAMVFRSSDGNVKASPPATMTGGSIAANGDAFLNLGTTIQPGISTSGNSINIVPITPLKFFKQYFVKSDPSSFQTAEGFGLSFDVNNTDWVFTTLNYPDKTPPVIAYTADNLDKGAGNKTISVGITDSISTGITAKIFYRKITTDNGVDSTALALNITNGKYEVSIPEAAYGPIGLEYYFKASDASANKARSPSGTGKYYSYINYKTTSTTTNPPLPTLPNGGTPANWRVIAIPYQLADNKVSTIFDELGAADKSAWRLLTYKNQTSWSEYPADFTTISQGLGYFINVKNSTNILIEGAISPNYNKETPFTKSLNAGWTQIGNPYPFTVTWEEVLTASGLTASSGLALKTFNGTYQAATSLKAFEGGFVFNSGTSPVQIKFPIDAAGGGGRQGAPLHTDLDGNDWVAPISLTIGDITSELGGVGMNPQATKSVDGFDDVTPPRFIDYLEMNFAHPEHFAKNLDRDIVPTENEYAWDFSVDSNLKGFATLSWDNNAFGNGHKDLFLLDQTLQQLIDMRSVNHYQFDQNESSRFNIYFGDDLIAKIKPNRVTLGKPYPNPTSDVAFVNFTLPDGNSSYQVNLEVYDMMGRRVSTLVHDNLPSGFYNTEWNPSSDDLKSGLYLYRLVVNGQTGSETLAEKIILRK